MSFRWFQKRPTGCRAPDALEQWIIDQLQSLQPQNSPTVTISHRDSKGFQMRAAPAGQGGGTSIIQCVVTELYGVAGTPIDYIGVTKFDLATMTLQGSQFNCAKCISARQPLSEVIDGQTNTYSNYNAVLLPQNSADNVRLATFSETNNSYQVVHPRYLVYQDPIPEGSDIGQYLILVSTVQNNIGMTDNADSPVNYIEVEPNRYWAWSSYLNGGNS